MLRKIGCLVVLPLLGLAFIASVGVGTSILATTPSAQATNDIPPQLLGVYQAAADTCPGLPWTVLAAIGKVESDHGRSTAKGVHSGANFAGAAGPMQIGIGGKAGPTFQAYAVDGNGDGVAKVYDPVDAIFTAAHYLCANGAGGGRDVGGAIFAYNHAGWYVTKVRAIAVSYQPVPPPQSKFVAPQTPSYARLTPTAKRVYELVVTTFGVRSIGGWRPKGSVAASDHPYGRAIDVRTGSPSPQSWAIAKWAVANAEALDIKYVIHNGRIWTPYRGWRSYRHPSDPCNCNPTLRHDDHVHISVRH